MQDKGPEWIGRRLVLEGLVKANFGNMSIRAGNGFFIKRSGAFLDAPWNPIFTPLDGEVPREVSTEWQVHREIYLKTPYDAVLHAHPPHAVALSLLVNEVIPVDSEGRLLAPRIPVVEGEPGSIELARSVASVISESQVVIARGHGTFAAGMDLMRAYILTSVVEHSSLILLLSRQS